MASAGIGTDALLDELRHIVGDRHVLSPANASGYTRDWTGRFGGAALGVVRPGSTAEVQGLLQWCREHGIAVVPQGGNTGLVGGSTPRGGELVLSTTRLKHLGPVDSVAGSVVVGAGVTLSELQAHAAPYDLSLPIDFAARGSATIGGMVATNAGGMRVMRYGAMQAHVQGVEAVLPDGRVISRLKQVKKDNTGYPLAALLTGSEGTLAVITQVCVRLHVLYAHRVTALVGLHSLAALPEMLVELRRSLPELEAAELLMEDGLALACAHAGLRPPLASHHAAVLIVECAGPEDPTERLAGVLATLVPLDDVVVGDDSRGRETLWAYRERLLDAIAAAGTPVKIDVSVPIRDLADFVTTATQRVRNIRPEARTIVFGHIAEGNLHVNVLDAAEVAEDVEDVVLRTALDLGGSIAAEHGIGIAKTRWLEEDRSVDVSVMRSLKQALDPAGLLNPGVILRRTSDGEEPEHPS